MNADSNSDISEIENVKYFYSQSSNLYTYVLRGKVGLKAISELVMSIRTNGC